MTKKELRLLIKEKLKTNAKNLKKWSEIICEKVIESQIYNNSDYIFLYMALSDEVDVYNIIQKAVSDNKKVFIPRIVPDTNQMDFYQYKSLKSLEKGSFGINEPLVKENLIFSLDHAYNKKILILVPGRAFSISGKRVGRGKGFYDIYIKKLIESQGKERIHVAGVCFPCQIVEDIPIEEHDVVMDSIFTVENTDDTSLIINISSEAGSISKCYRNFYV